MSIGGLMITIVFMCFVSIPCALAMAQNSWSSEMLRAFFTSKEIHLVDAYLCNSKDGEKLWKGLKQPSYSPIFWRVSKNFSTEEIREKRVGIFLDASCRRNQNLLEHRSNRLWFDVVYTWLIWDPEETFSKTNLPDRLSIFSDVLVTSGVDFHQVVKFSGEAPVQMIHAGSWDGDLKMLDVHFPKMKPDLHKSVVVGALYAVQDIYHVANISAQMLDRKFKHGWDSGNRFFYVLILGLADLYNFRVEIKKAFDWGKKINGTWTGIIRQLQVGESDIAFTPMLPFPERLEHSYGAPSVQQYWFALIFKQPRALGTYKALTLELSGTVWALFGVFLLTGSAVYALTLKYEEKQDKTPVDVGIFQTIGIFANQGLTFLPQTASSRIVCFSSLFVGFLVSTYYSSATMTALLSEAPPSIRTLDDFIGSDVPINLLNATYNTRKSETWKVFRPRLLEKIEKTHVKVLEIDGGLEVIQKGEAFCGESYILFEGIEKTFTDEEKCALTVFSSIVKYTGMRFVRKDKHLLEMFSRGLTKSQERGLVKKGRDDWIAGPPTCFRTVPFMYVTLEAVSVAFGTLLAGMFLSTVFFVVECLQAHQCCRKRGILPGMNKVGSKIPLRVVNVQSFLR